MRDRHTLIYYITLKFLDAHIKIFLTLTRPLAFLRAKYINMNAFSLLAISSINYFPLASACRENGSGVYTAI